MKLPLSWLRDYVDIGDITPQQLSDKLLSIGFEVEAIISPRTNIKGVVVGRIERIVHHDNSDKLWICSVNIGEQCLQIVTGAQNVKQGDYVPVATVGAILPDGTNIQPAKFRGVDSVGMLCGGSELEVTDDIVEGASVNGILILPNDFTIGKDILDELGLGDTVLDVSITANRPDCQAVINLAREISVLLNKPFKMPNLKYKQSGTGDVPTVKIEDKSLCSRYLGRVIRNIKIERSPKWLRNRLRLCGIRPINNIVDITNYVLLEIGQPLHAFDKKFIDGGIIVRKGRENEKIVALDGKEYSVDGVLVIADHKKPLAIAGIMGGEYTSIFSNTDTAFLEVARFERSNIRHSSRIIGLRSDSSARFEKGVDWNSVDIGAARALALICELKCGSVCEDVASDGVSPPEQKIIRTSKEQLCSLLGIDIDCKIIVSILKKQGFDVKLEDKTLVCTVPLVREDVDGYPDLAEDIMRFYGYDNITSTNAENTRQTCGGLSVHDENARLLSARLCALGIDETLNYSFVSPDAADKLLLDKNDRLRNVIPIINPLSRDISVMRTQLAYSMLGSISRNCSRKNSSMRFFELGKVFIPNGLPLKELPQEHDVLCIACCNSGDFYTLKSIVSEALGLFGVPTFVDTDVRYLHPKQSLHVELNGISGDFGKLHPLVCENFGLPSEIYIAHLDISDALNAPIGFATYKQLSKLHPVDRDLALVVKKNTAVGDMLKAICKVSDCISDVKLFDVYEGSQIAEGYKSVAFSLRLQPTECSFTDDMIKDIMNAVIKKAESDFGARLR